MTYGRGFYVRMPENPTIDKLILLADGDYGLVIEATRACLRGDDPPVLEDVVAYIAGKLDDAFGEQALTARLDKQEG